jgi:hypothetical protein
MAAPPMSLRISRRRSAVHPLTASLRAVSKDRSDLLYPSGIARRRTLACGTIVANATTYPALFGRALRVALCYLFALQAFAASISIVSAIGFGGAVGLTPAICHGSGDEPPSGDSSLPPTVPCALCAAAASTVALPAPILVAAQPMPVASRAQHPETVVPARSPPPRAGLARAPPHFA